MAVTTAIAVDYNLIRFGTLSFQLFYYGDPMATSSSTSSSISSSVSSTLTSAGTSALSSGASAAALEAADLLAQDADAEYVAFEEAAASQAMTDYANLSSGDSRLVKAALIPRTGDSAPTIEFMFNPTDLQFSRSVTIEDVKGSRTFRGLPKVNFGFIEAYKLQLSGLVFDTYETGQDVYELISPLRDSVDFSSFRDPFEETTITTASGETLTYTERTLSSNIGTSALSGAASAIPGASTVMSAATEYGIDVNTQALELRRPPVYYFIWGTHNYLTCMIESLSFKLTMFLPDGTPVRAMVDLSLKEVDLGVASYALSART